MFEDYEHEEDIINPEDDLYSQWMREFENSATPENGYHEDIDIDYNIVDDLYYEKLSVSDAIHEYFNR